MGHCDRRGIPVQSNPFATRLLSRLLYQLVPAALVTTVGVLLLSNLAKVTDTPAAAPVETAINAEAVFRIVPREPSAEVEADARHPKTLASRIAVTPKPASAQARKVEPAAPRQVASAPAPLPIVPVTEQPAPATADGESTVMGKLRSATASVQRIPQWAARSVAGWFAAADAPPRPPAAVPGQDFQAAM
jgi:hypothetical protein